MNNRQTPTVQIPLFTLFVLFFLGVTLAITLFLTIGFWATVGFYGLCALLIAILFYFAKEGE